MEPTIAGHTRLDGIAEPVLPVKYARASGWRPSPGDNPLGAWYWLRDQECTRGGACAPHLRDQG
jgi:hypothetical protein